MVLCADYKRMKYSLASDTEQHFDRKLSVNGVQRKEKRTNNILNSKLSMHHYCHKCWRKIEVFVENLMQRKSSLDLLIQF